MIIIANLDCELVMARGSGQRSESLPLAAQRTASALGTLLRAFAVAGDRLWTLLPVDPDRVPDVGGIAPVEFVSGPIALDDEILRWGETSGVASDVNNRSFSFALAKERGWALEGTAILHSVFAIEQHVAAVGATASPSGKWVLKQPLSAAGRSRVFGAGSRCSDTALAGAQRLLIAQDSVLFEPWMDRVADLSATGWVTDDGPERIAGHRLRVDDAGRFRGIGIDPAHEPPEPVLEAAQVVGGELRDRGYRGPYGIDAYQYRDKSGRVVVNPLSEINARMTFGHVARRLAKALKRPRLVLRVGGGTCPAGPGVLPLLHAGHDDRTVAWVEAG